MSTSNETLPATFVNELSDQINKEFSELDENTKNKILLLHRPERKMRQNIVMICIFYNYVSNNLTNAPL